MLFTIVFIILTILILTQSSTTLYYDLNGLTLWYSKMVPALLPFMILSGIMIRMNLTEKVVSFIHPILKPIFKVRKNVSYGIVMGFLCGFPMGAKVTTDLWKRNMITDEEARYLLSFCNNIGPVYFVSFVIPLLNRKLILPYIIGMYGIPLLYGFILRYTKFININKKETEFVPLYFKQELAACNEKEKKSLFLLQHIDDAIKNSISSISMLCGYMILFNLLNIIPHFFFPHLRIYIAPLLEITGGLMILGTSMPLFSLLILPFGGFSCIAQTYSIIKDTNLSIKEYVLHKLLLTLLTGIFYLLWYLFFSSSFLL